MLAASGFFLLGVLWGDIEVQAFFGFWTSHMYSEVLTASGVLFRAQRVTSRNKAKEKNTWLFPEAL